MGWFVVVALKPAFEHIDAGALVLLLVGGLAYTGGVVFYLWERLPYNHAIWHLFVMAGSISHFFAVLYFV
jgi:hemolysin III